MRRYAFIYNPAARNGRSQSTANRLEEKLSELNHAHLFHSEAKGDIAFLVEDLAKDYDVIVACGGDGTVQEVASGLIGTNVIMGIIPMGTGNDLCKTLGIPTDLNDAFEVIKKGQLRAIDVGQCNNDVFLNSLGFGFDGLTNSFALQLNQWPSIFRYVIGALRATSSHKPFNVKVTTEEDTYYQKLMMITLANGRVEGGSFWVAPGADISDGKLEMVAIKPIQKCLIPFLLIFFLIKKSGWIPHVTIKKVSDVTLSFNETPEIHADGEVITSEENIFSISLIPKGLEVLV